MHTVKVRDRTATFLAELPARENRALLVDYDCAVEPFANVCAQSPPYESLAELLQWIAGSGTRLVLITNHTARELRLRIDLDPLPEIWGSRGLERLWPDGSYQLAPLDRRLVGALIDAQGAVAGSVIGPHLEHRPGALAVNWHGLSTSTIDRLRTAAVSAWRLFTKDGLELSEFENGVELRMADHPRADVVSAVLRELGPHSAVAYLGGGNLDEPGFSALRSDDLAVMVSPEIRETSASTSITAPEGLFDFLGRWLWVCGGAA